jgi:hypothetical protein
MGIATISYTTVHDTFEYVVYTTLTIGGQTFKGYITNASVNPIPNTDGWYETHATLIATTN